MTELAGDTDNGIDSTASDLDYSDELGSSPFPLFSSLAPACRNGNGYNGEVNGLKGFRRMSVKELKILRSEIGSTFADPNEERKSRVAALWRMACAKALQQGDPWEKFHLESLPMEIAKRHRYSAVKGQWFEDIVRVKLDGKPFGRGAMRECFRAKKLSNFSHIDDWLHASNFVAKSYIEPVNRQVYFDDVRLQMDAKLWGEEFSRQPSIARKVDIAQMCCLEFIHRPDKPVYHLEHFIEGTYRKYNSNSGFVDDVARNTPQAFSHFTFEQSGHRLIVVDIQGVGDLWTDPQIHTVDGKAYGDGNLGIRGMALFFHTHRCNPLCTALELGIFDLLPGEQDASGLLSHRIPAQLLHTSPPSAAVSRGDCHDDKEVDARGSGLTIDSPDLPSSGFGATEANPRGRQRRTHQRLTSYNNGGVSESGFIDSDDFCEAHSLPSDNPYHPLRFIASPAFAGESPLMTSENLVGDSCSSSATSSSSALHRQGRRRRTGVCNGVERSCDSGVCLVNRATPAQRFFPITAVGDEVRPTTCLVRDQERQRHLTSGSSSGDGGGGLMIDNGTQRNDDWLERRSQDLAVGDERKGGDNCARFNEAELMKVIAAHRDGHRSSSVGGLHIANAGILGLIHHELASLHASGRFAPKASQAKPGDLPSHGESKSGTPMRREENFHPSSTEQGLDALVAIHAISDINWEAAVFHEEQAAVLQCSGAIECMAQYYLDLPINGPLADCPLRPDPNEAPLRGLSLISTAASSGDRSAMLYLADIYYSGRSLATPPAAERGSLPCSPDWLAAVHWYDAASRVLDDEGCVAEDSDLEVGEKRSPPGCTGRLLILDNLCDWPVYKIHGRLAEMFSRGGYGLEKDTTRAYELFESAADGASEARQGRLAMYYYDQAALFECDEP